MQNVGATMTNAIYVTRGPGFVTAKCNTCGHYTMVRDGVVIDQCEHIEVRFWPPQG